MRLLLPLLLCAFALLAQAPKTEPTPPAKKAAQTPIPPDLTKPLHELTTAVRENKATDYTKELVELREAIAKAQGKDALDIINTILSGGALLIVAITAFLTYRMAKYASTQATAAQEQAKFSQEQSVAAQHMLEEARAQSVADSRPIVVPTGTRLLFSGTGPRLDFPVRNIGRGPAFHVRLYAYPVDTDGSSLAVLEEGINDKLSIPINNFKTAKEVRSVGDLVRSLKQRESPLMFVTFEYEDVFDNTWESLLSIEPIENDTQLSCRFVETKPQVKKTLPN
jgi:hypothetical protein